MSPPPDGSVTLHSSWRGIILNASGALIVLAVGMYSVSSGGVNVISVIILLMGMALVAVVLSDYPIASSFSADGIVRRMMLRHQHIDWDRIDQLSRTRPKLLASFRKIGHGGLVAVIGKRRYLLVDHCESRDEFKEIERITEDRADEIGLDEVPRPTKGTAPTWVYRRSKWAPDRPERR
jgi:hypothetical protein